MLIFSVYSQILMIFWPPNLTSLVRPLAGFINNLVAADCILSELFHVGDC